MKSQRKGFLSFIQVSGRSLCDNSHHVNFDLERQQPHGPPKNVKFWALQAHKIKTKVSKLNGRIKITIWSPKTKTEARKRIVGQTWIACAARLVEIEHKHEEKGSRNQERSIRPKKRELRFYYSFKCLSKPRKRILSLEREY